jgi:hypothetical protein
MFHTLKYYNLRNFVVWIKYDTGDAILITSRNMKPLTFILMELVTVHTGINIPALIFYLFKYIPLL